MPFCRLRYLMNCGQASLLHLQQHRLHLQPSPIAGEGAALADDAVTGHRYEDRIGSDGSSHRSYGSRPADSLGDVGVGAGAAIGDVSRASHTFS